MSLDVDVQFDTRQATRFLRLLRRPGVQDATRRALNKAGTQTRTEASKGIRKDRNLKAGLIKKQMRLRKASRSRLRAVIVATGKVISLREYGAKATRKGVTVKVSKSKGRQLVPGAFFGPGGHVFRREGKKRLPIRKLWGPSLPSAFIKDAVVSAMRSKVGKVYPRLLKHEVEREIAKAARRG